MSRDAGEELRYLHVCPASPFSLLKLSLESEKKGRERDRERKRSNIKHTISRLEDS